MRTGLADLWARGSGGGRWRGYCRGGTRRRKSRGGRGRCRTREVAELWGRRRQGKARNRLAQRSGQVRELDDGLRRGVGAFGGLDADLSQHLRVACDVLGGRRLAARAAGEVLPPARQLVQHLLVPLPPSPPL